MKKSSTIRPAKTIVALMLCALHFAPLYILISMSFKSKADVGSRWAPPSQLYWQNFVNAYQLSNMLNALKNTLLVVVFAVFFVVALGALAAYPLSRYASRVNRLVLATVLAVMMVPQLSILVPLYREIVTMGGVNQYWGIIVVSVTYNLPMSIYMYCNFIATIPKELDEAAMIDGCNKISVFFRMILPSLKSVTASVIIWTGIGIWNDYQFQLYFLQKPKLRTITLTMASFFTENRTDLGAAAAASVLAVLPPILVYLFLQKYFVRGVMDSAVKA